MEKKCLAFAVVVSAACLCAMPIAVQGQAIIMRKELSSEAAQTIARGAIERCRADGFQVSVSVVDSRGQLIAFIRDDGANPATVDFSRKKAYTALVYRRPTSETGKMWVSQAPAPPPNVTDATGTPGGVPIKAGNEVIAGVGISGGQGPTSDETCGNAGIAKVAEQLK